MPPDALDEEFTHAAANAIVGMLRAVEEGDRLALIGELNLLLAAITEHGNRESRQATALGRALDRVRGMV